MGGGMALTGKTRGWTQPGHFTTQRWWDREGGAIALVTGANQGIGLAAARALAAQGVTTVLSARDMARGAAAAASVEAEFGKQTAYFVQLDVTDVASCCRAADEVFQRFGRLDILLNNAGLAFKGDTFECAATLQRCDKERTDSQRTQCSGGTSDARDEPAWHGRCNARISAASAKLRLGAHRQCLQHGWKATHRGRGAARTLRCSAQPG
jgi:hypothetical protein